MEHLNTVLVLLFKVFAQTLSLQCYQHYSSSIGVANDVWTAVTCDPGVTACSATINIDSGNTMRSYGCAFRNTCHDVAHGTNISTLIQSCCYTDLCNNKTSFDFEDDEDYCYSGQCDYEGCLDELINTMHKHEVGAFCKAGDNGCQMMKRRERMDDGTWRLFEYISCSEPYPCVTGNSKTDIEHWDKQCCNGHLCTANDTGDADAGQDSCYQYYCLSTKKGHCHPPTDLAEAVKQGRANLCPRTEKGCYYYEGYGMNKHHYEFATGCFEEGFLGFDECAPVITKQGDVTTKLQCCNSDRCNSFSAQHNNTREDQCYSISCSGEDCLESYKEAGNYWLCDKTQHGCQIGVIDTGLESVFTIGCATAACEKGTVTEEGLSVIGCCTGDRCLPQALISGASQLNITGILCVLLVLIRLL